MSVLTKEQILAADDLPRELVPCPEWGGDVWVHAWSGEDRAEYELFLFGADGKRTGNERYTREKHAVISVRDDNGQRLFTNADIAALKTKGAAPLNRIYVISRRLSKMDVKDIEELEKNSESGPSAAGG